MARNDTNSTIDIPPLPQAPNIEQRHIEFVHQIRLEEFAAVSRYLPKTGRILEIGAGTGFQAKMLQERGLDVDALDLADGNYRSHELFPVATYDGHTLPFPDRTFDVVFSSNVLEHIPHVVEFQTEILRVLKVGGIAVHIVPSAAWRIWTSLAHYPALVQKAIRWARREPAERVPNTSTATSRGSSRPLESLKRIAAAPRHGERGTALSEVWLYTRRAWGDLFENAGWTVVHAGPTGVFYTGYSLLGARFNAGDRKFVGRSLYGSCTSYYVLRASDE